VATQTLATADAILKDLYRGPIIEQLNYKTYMLDMIERDSDSVDFTGRRAIFPVHSSPNMSTTSIPDGGTLPIPGIQGYQDGIVNIRYHAAGMELTDMSIKQATGNEGAFVNLLDNDSKLLAQDMRKQINRQRVGQPIDIVTISNGTVRAASVTITAINRTTKVLTLSAAVTATTTTDGITAPGAYGNEMEGLRSIAGTNRTLHGINSATAGNEFWNSNTRDAASATAGESLFEQLADDVGQGGNGEVDVFLTTRGIRRRLADTYQSTKRFSDARAVNIHGGYTAIMVNEIPVVSDDDVPKGYVFALNRDAFKWFQLQDPDWLTSDDGTIWHLKTGSTAGSRSAAWQAWFTWYAALGCLAPNRVGVITNAADDAAVGP
jgi:hypothetical protein